MAVETLNSIQPALFNANQQLASGSRINQSADDAAGQAVVTALTSQINQQDVASRNANTGVNLIQTADGATSSITDQVQRLRELSLQAQNGTYSDAQRNALNVEFQQGIQSIQQISEATSFNGINLFDGSLSNVSIALGDSTSDITLPDLTSANLGLDTLDLSSVSNATSALDQLGIVLETLGDARSQFGAQQNGLTSAVSQIYESNVNFQATRSQINDADYAQTITERTRLQILENASVAMQSHQNQQQESVLSLLS